MSSEEVMFFCSVGDNSFLENMVMFFAFESKVTSDAVEIHNMSCLEQNLSLDLLAKSSVLRSISDHKFVFGVFKLYTTVHIEQA